MNEYSVTQISNSIKQIVEQEFGYVRVKGEISGLKIASSGHGYFNLKDDNAVLASTCWKHALGRLKCALSEGMEVIATGKITTYAGQSKYQLSVEHIEHSGVGALMKVLSERKAKFQAEGLFDSARKKALPFFPQTIGVVTSLSGAVIKDIIHRISDRCPVRVVVWPVAVQGDGAAEEIAQAIHGFNTLAENIPDVMIIARGGGSVEDLWAFNEEIVVRAIVSSKIPIISAVGHETDFTLSDFAADVRAPTPTAAAEFATPVIADLKYTVKTFGDRITQFLYHILKHKADIIRAYDKTLSSPMSMILTRQQHLDNVLMMRDGMAKHFLATMILRVERLTPNTSSCLKIVDMKSMQLHTLSGALSKSISDLYLRIRTSVEYYDAILNSLDYKKVLHRGFAILRSSSGQVVSSIDEASKCDQFNLELRDGKILLQKATDT